MIRPQVKRLTTLVMLAIGVQCLFDAKARYKYIDSTCDPWLEWLDQGGQDYEDMIQAASSLTKKSEKTDLEKVTYKAFWYRARQDTIGLGYDMLIEDWKKQPIDEEIWCNVTAFAHKIVMDDNGKSTPAFCTLEGHYDPGKGPLCIVNANPIRKRDNMCLYSMDNKLVEDIAFSPSRTSPGAARHWMFLCPAAFGEPLLSSGTTKTQMKLTRWVQMPGTTFASLHALGMTILHEKTHIVLGTVHFAHFIGEVLDLARRDEAKNLQNAQTFMFFGAASLLTANVWVMGVAQWTWWWGPEAPPYVDAKVKRDITPLPEAIDTSNTTRPLREGRGLHVLRKEGPAFSLSGPSASMANLFSVLTFCVNAATSSAAAQVSSTTTVTKINVIEVVTCADPTTSDSIPEISIASIIAEDLRELSITPPAASTSFTKS